MSDNLSIHNVNIHIDDNDVFYKKIYKSKRNFYVEILLSVEF